MMPGMRLETTSVTQPWGLIEASKGWRLMVATLLHQALLFVYCMRPCASAAVVAVFTSDSPGRES